MVLQNSYFKHISEKGFKLERGELVEETNREHFTVQEYKKCTPQSVSKSKCCFILILFLFKYFNIASPIVKLK